MQNLLVYLLDHRVQFDLLYFKHQISTAIRGHSIIVALFREYIDIVLIIFEVLSGDYGGEGPLMTLALKYVNFASWWL
jgi:hypothetical protein